MKNKDMYVCFRHKNKDSAIIYSCIQENKLWDNMPHDSNIVYLDMDDSSIEK